MDATTLLGMVSACTALVAKSKWKDHWEQGRGPLNTEPALLEKFERIVLAQSKIRLLINPGDEDQQHLGEAIEAATRRLRSEDASDAETKPKFKPLSRWRSRSSGTSGCASNWEPSRLVGRR